ncbi:efflux RND transporter permease subunit [Desulfogranum mediterraneum]|uniref:efflux RND transporter permease subunit n=1 Tax=Desulfogranum mediterraneum TaxID=160661 RepID=UPI0004293DF9|nr:efflux RND transporter permease subunit [Desulfogranum mediterraneum]
MKLEPGTNPVKTRPGVPGQGAIHWMATNPVAANILMLFFLLGGLYWGSQIRQEVFPEFQRDEVRISVAYPGASAEEVVDGIILPVEEAISSLEGIAQVYSSALEGRGTIIVEALIDTDLQQLAIDITKEVDRIDAFPEDAEEPLVRVPTRRRSVITVILSGELGDEILKQSAEALRDQLQQDPLIAQLEIQGDRPREIAIEVSRQTLRAHGLSLQELARRVRSASLDLPGGTVKTKGGQIQLQMKERRDLGREFAAIPIITSKDGGQLLLGELATIRDGFADTDTAMRYNGKPALGIEVFRVGEQGPIEISRAVRNHIRDLGPTLAEGLELDIVNDRSLIYQQRLNLLLKNGYLGLVLVFLLLGLFLEPRLAFWVTMGIPVSFLGSLLFLPFFQVSVNMVSLFAFIVSLGIVVDDTIIIGENVYRLRQQGHAILDAAILGAREMAAPVTFAVLTNIVTFMPLYFVPGTMGKIFRAIPVVVALVFMISLIEALFVLPAHLGRQRALPGKIGTILTRFQARISTALSRLIKTAFTPMMVLAMRYRYVSTALGLTILLLSAALIQSGRMGMTMFPRVESDRSFVSFSLPIGMPVEKTQATLTLLVRAAQEVTARHGDDTLVQGIQASFNDNSGWVKVYLTPPHVRPLSTRDFTRLWQEQTGPLPGLESIRFRSNFGGPGSGAGLTVEVQHRDPAILEQVSARMVAFLATFPMVSEIEDGFERGKQQFDVQLSQVGYRFGLTPDGVARQIRNSYYGREVLRQLRGRDEVKVMIRSPLGERSSLDSLEQMMIQTPEGGEVPLTSVVTITPDRAPTSIEQRDGRRVIEVTADVSPPEQSDLIVEALKAELFPKLSQHYPGVSFSFEGKQADRRASLAALGRGMMVALLIVYILLAVIFRSYSQPLIVMMAIPFGIVGAVIGHLIMGYSLSLVSFFGIVALSGVVVNDALVLIDLANRKRCQDHTAYAAVINAAVIRFRPILLTTLTTFFGLLPIIFETSRQARFLIPMAISLGFGILFATAITLILVPSLYLILEDILQLFRPQTRE